MNSKQENFSKQVPLALAAIGQHIHEHHLPNPISIDIDSVELKVTVRVPSETGQQEWLNTLVVDGEENRPWQGPIWVRTAWTVRLPDLGIQFELVGLRRNPVSSFARTLSVVSA